MSVEFVIIWLVCSILSFFLGMNVLYGDKKYEDLEEYSDGYDVCIVILIAVLSLACSVVGLACMVLAWIIVQFHNKSIHVGHLVYYLAHPFRSIYSIYSLATKEQKVTYNGDKNDSGD